jgi:transposase
MPESTRKPYPSDVSDEEWALVAPYLTLLREDCRQRRYPLREVFNAMRWMVRAGAPWRLIPHEFPPWTVVHQQAQRWIAAGVFEALVHDLRAVLRLAAERTPQRERDGARRAHLAKLPRERRAGRLRRGQKTPGQ